MESFDKEKLLQIILEEAPILNNRRGIVKLKQGEEVVERVIYAYYCNRGVPDPDLAYDRRRNPIKTTPQSTLCEIYSFWEGDPNVQRLKNELTKRGKRWENSDQYQGPWQKDWTYPAESARMGMPYDFCHSAGSFQRHFNKLCKKLKFNSQLVDELHGNYCVESFRNISLDGRQINLNIRTHLGFNLNLTDPTLNDVLDSIQSCTQKLERFDVSKAIIYVN